MKFSKLSPEEQEDAREIFEERLYQEIDSYLEEYATFAEDDNIPETYIDEEIKRVADGTIQDDGTDNWDRMLSDSWENDWFRELIGMYGTLYKLYNLTDVQDVYYEKKKAKKAAKKAKDNVVNEASKEES